MTKTGIDLFEETLIQEGLTDQNLETYEKLLRKAGDDWNRIQHCFLTAYQFPVDKVEEAAKLIEFGNERYASEERYLIHSNQYLGLIYRRAGLYQKAYEVYASIYQKFGDVKGTFPWNMLESKLYADNFTYSVELEECIELCQQESVFAKSFRDNKFKLALADYIVASHDSDIDKMKVAYSTICEVAASDYKGTLKDVLTKHKAIDVFHITEECRVFLKGISEAMEKGVGK
ncbi:MAG: hypothetical protein HUJ56_03140 [Erysipelotrichaceae bacterium]|nr:hypothetical protein [Erysipelotrichaceae bacterium]